jgi:hypothetical protein
MDRRSLPGTAFSAVVAAAETMLRLSAPVADELEPVVGDPAL